MAAGLFVVVWLPIVLGARDLPSPTPDADPVDFARDVLPVLEAQCFECHGPQKARGRLRLDSRRAALKGGMTGPALIPGDSENSLLIRRVLGLDGEDRMPLDADPLPDDQVARLRAWIDQGAPWPGEDEPTAADAVDEPPHWAYRPPVRPEVPKVRQADRVRNPIDAFILARLEREGLTLSPEASREALARRVYLDLIGLPPSPEELDAFLADTRPDAYERLVDSLLASPRARR